MDFIKSLKPWHKIVIVLLVIGFIGKAIKPDQKPFKIDPANKPYTEQLLKVRIENFAKQLVLQKLKAPATAKFTDDITYTKVGNEIAVTGKVDAVNSFNANIRSNWYVLVDFNGVTEADMDNIQYFKVKLVEIVNP